MDWTLIVSGIFGLFAAVDLGRIIFFRSSKRQAQAEAEEAEKEVESTAVATLRNAIEMLNAQLEYANSNGAAKDETIERLTREKSELQMRIQALYDDMCVHKGCKVRKPHQGQGLRWYELHADDPSLGCDYLSIDTLLRNWRMQNGEKVKKAVGVDCPPEPMERS